MSFISHDSAETYFAKSLYCVTLTRAVRSLASFQTRLVSKICIPSNVAKILRLTNEDPNGCSSVFHRSKEIELFAWLQFSNSFYTGMRAKKNGKSFKQYFRL